MEELKGGLPIRGKAAEAFVSMPGSSQEGMNV